MLPEIGARANPANAGRNSLTSKIVKFFQYRGE